MLLKKFIFTLVSKVTNFLDQQQKILFVPLLIIIGICLYYFCDKCSLSQEHSFDILIITLLIFALLIIAMIVEMLIINRDDNIIDDRFCYLRFYFYFGVLIIVVSFGYSLFFNHYFLNRNISTDYYIYGDVVGRVTAINGYRGQRTTN